MHRCYSATILHLSNVVSGRHHASWTAATGRVLLEPGAKLVMKLLHLVCSLSEFLGTRDKVSVSCETKLDNGWPESVEEQSPLVLVWKHYIRRQYIKDL